MSRCSELPVNRPGPPAKWLVGLVPDLVGRFVTNLWCCGSVWWRAFTRRTSRLRLYGPVGRAGSLKERRRFQGVELAGCEREATVTSRGWGTASSRA